MDLQMILFIALIIILNAKGRVIFLGDESQNMDGGEDNNGN